MPSLDDLALYARGAIPASPELLRLAKEIASAPDEWTRRNIMDTDWTDDA